MQNFDYQNPTRVRFGKGVIDGVGAELRGLGLRRVLFLYGQGSIRQNGVYTAVTTSLRESGIEVVEHRGVRGNPRLAHVREGIEKARKASVDGILAVGGGSVIDAAKATAMGIVAATDVWDFFSGRAKPETCLPVVAVLTLPATGSEMNGICVVTNEETAEKNALVCPGLLNPRASFLDPETTMTLSMQQTAFACTDILSHMMEAYFTTSAEHLAVQDNLIEGTARGTVEAMAVIQKNPQDYDARAAFMWAATLAWSGILQAGIPSPTMPCHALEMPMSAVYDMAHGAGLSVVIPAWMKCAGERHAARILRFVQVVLGEETRTTLEAAVALRAFYQRIGSPVTFTDAGVPNPDIEKLTELASRAFVQRNMRDYTTGLIEAIYRNCL